MPKLPRGSGKATTKERAKKPAAKKAATPASSKAPAQKKANGAAAPKKKPAAPRSNGRRATAKPAPGRDFRHRPVDRAEVHEPAGPKTKLTDDQRVLLGDLFAVVEEHSGESAEEIDRKLVERAFVFSCERHADQRRASGEEFIVHPIGVAKISRVSRALSCCFALGIEPMVRMLWSRSASLTRMTRMSRAIATIIFR